MLKKGNFVKYTVILEQKSNMKGNRTFIALFLF